MTTPRAGALVAGAGVLAATWCALTPGWYALPAGLLLALVLPGLALVGAAFPPGTITPAERVTLVPALSLAVLVLGGLLLSVTGIGLGRVAWAALLAAVTAVATVVAARRSGRGATAGPTPAAPDVPPAAPDVPPAAPGSRPRWTRTAATLVAVALLAGTVAFSWHSALRAPQPAFTALWAVPPGVSSQPDVIRLGVDNHEAAATAYTVHLTGSRGLSGTWQVDLPAGGSWTQDVPYTHTQGVVVTLTRAGQGEPYRTVSLSAQVLP